DDVECGAGWFARREPFRARRDDLDQWWPVVGTAGKAEALDIAPDHGGRPRVGLHEERVRRSPRDRLESNRPGTGIKIEYARLGEATAHRFKSGEETLARTVGGRS